MNMTENNKRLVKNNPIRNLSTLYRQGCENQGQTTLQVQNNTTLAVSNADRTHLTSQSLHMHDGVLNLFDEANLGSNKICNFITRDYSTLFKKCGNFGYTGKTEVSANSDGHLKSKGPDVEAGMDSGKTVLQFLNQEKLASYRSPNQDSRSKQSYSSCNSTAKRASSKHDSDFRRTEMIQRTNNTTAYEYQPHFSTLSKNEPEAVQLKISLQYFPSVRQLRISLYHAKCVEEDNCRLVTKVALIERRGHTKKESKQAVTKSNSAVFNQCIYLNVKREDFTKRKLRLRLCKVRGGLRKDVQIGGVILSLHELNIDLETTLNITLSTPEEHRQVINGEYIQISRDATLEEEIMNALKESDPYFLGI